MKRRSPSLACFPSCLLSLHGLKHVISSQPSIVQYISFPNFQQPIGIWVSSKSDVLSEHRANKSCFNTSFHRSPFPYNKNCPFRDSNPDLVDHNLPCASHTTSGGLPIILGSWNNWIVQPNSRGAIPQFSHPIPQSTQSTLLRGVVKRPEHRLSTNVERMLWLFLKVFSSLEDNRKLVEILHWN